MKNLTELFTELHKANLTLNLNKSEFGKAQVTYLGYVIGHGKIAPISTKIEPIINFPIPSDKKSLHRFLGICAFYRRFCPNFSEIATPLTNLLSAKTLFVWSEDCNQAFFKIKRLLESPPVLRSPDFSKKFEIQNRCF